MEESYERKMRKYSVLTDQCRSPLANSVLSSRSRMPRIPGQFIMERLNMLGLVEKERRDVINEAGKRAQSASLWKWRRRSTGKMAEETSLGADVRHTTPTVMTDAQLGQVCNDRQAAEP